MRRARRAARPLGAGAPETLSVLMTFKVTNDDRASILKVVLDRLNKDLAGSNVPLHISDASSDQYAGLARDYVASISSEVNYRRDDEPMSLSYQKLLHACSTPYCYLQFDDQITTNLSSDFLLAACKLLDAYESLVPVVTAVWPVEVEIDEERRRIEVLTHRRGTSRLARGDTYEFGFERPHRPVLVDEVDGYRFGIFENFYYGFYFNHIITRPEDYARRLHWYLANVGSASVHDIENAASDRTLGPFWTHIAVCLDGVSLLDVDYAHTETSVRREATTARKVYTALSRGFDINATQLDRNKSRGES